MANSLGRSRQLRAIYQVFWPGLLLLLLIRIALSALKCPESNFTSCEMSTFERLRKKNQEHQIMKTITNTQAVERMNSHIDRRNQPGSFDPVGFTVVPPRGRP